ncbi:hypothetical protein F5Y12DRAFT_187300 [Xylaria sp. FL1777]|nr:hypothetical protein F5Y12DRAFT_187300 [Xylaria sp. FL1777]
MVTTGASISDGWEHVDDNDDFSVISLPMSEDDAPNPSRDRTVTTVLRSPPDNGIHPSHQPPSENLVRSHAHPHDTNQQPDRNKAVEMCGMDMKDVVEPDTPQAPAREITNQSDFDCILATTFSLVNLVPKILHTPGYFDTRAKELAKPICEHLLHLEIILRGYSKHRRPGSKPTELPVGLSEWLDNLKSELGKGRKSSKEPATQSQASLGNDYYERLSSLSSQMDGLMTVIRSDFEDFHTLDMPVVTSENDMFTNCFGQPPHSSHPVIATNNNLAHLRRELYVLRDQIVSCLGEIHCCEQHGISNSGNQRRNMTALSLSYTKTKQSLELILSNHGNDWIEYSTAGGLTYPQFCRLNPDTIRSVILQLKEVTDDLFLERCRVQSLRYGNDPDSIMQNEELIFKKSSMDALQSIEELLISILKLRRDA